jgi:hypothetical protein
VTQEDECRDFWRQVALSMPAESVDTYLEIFAEDLDKIRQQVETLKDRADISEEDRRIAERIYAGLEAWSELIFDAEG